jgi:iron complex outermembrane receptor protein
LFASALSTPSFYQNPNTHQFVYQNNVPNDNRQETFETSAKLDHDLGWATLTAWGLYSHTRNDLLADGTSAAFGFFNAAPLCKSSVATLYASGVKLPSPTYLGPTPAASLLGAYTPTTCDGYQYQLREEEDESLEVRLASPSHDRLRWLAGAYYLHSDHPVGVATGVDSGGAPPRELYVPRNEPYDTEQLLYDDFSSNVGAAFGQVEYDIVHNLEGSAALRYDNEDRHDHNLVPADALTNYIEYSGPPYTGGAPLNPALDPLLNPGGVHDRDKDFDHVEPKLALRWTATQDWSLYADWGIGFKSGGFNNQGSAATINTFINPIRTAAGYAPVDISDEYKAETSSEYELGAKGRLLDGRLTVDAAVYDDVVRNSQFFEFFVGAFGLLRVVSNIDRIDLDGAELSLGYQLTPDLTLSAATSYTYSRIDKNSVRPDTVGNEAPYTPKYTWNIAAEYDKPWLAAFTLHARVDVRGTGPTWFSDVQKQNEPTIFYALYGPLGIGNYSQTERQAYTIVNLRLGISKDHWALTLFADNLFDTRYLNEIIPAPEFGGVFASPAEGGRYGVEASYKF